MIITAYKLKLRFISVLFFISGALFAQNDSISFGEEPKDGSDYNFRKTYQYLDIKMKNEKWLVKLTPYFDVRDTWKELSFEIAFERKLTKAISLQIYNKTEIGFIDELDVFEGNFSLELRYYPGMTKRVANGLSGNNLNGLYLSAGGSDLVKYSNGKISNYDRIGFLNWHPAPFGTIGYQNRLNNWAYLDVFAIVTYNNYSLYFGGNRNTLYSTLGFRLGFAWGNK